MSQHTQIVPYTGGPRLEPRGGSNQGVATEGTPDEARGAVDIRVEPQLPPIVLAPPVLVPAVVYLPREAFENARAPEGPQPRLDFEPEAVHEAAHEAPREAAPEAAPDRLAEWLDAHGPGAQGAWTADTAREFLCVLTAQEPVWAADDAASFDVALAVCTTLFPLRTKSNGALRRSASRTLRALVVFGVFSVAFRALHGGAELEHVLRSLELRAERYAFVGEGLDCARFLFGVKALIPPVVHEDGVNDSCFPALGAHPVGSRSNYGGSWRSFSRESYTIAEVQRRATQRGLAMPSHVYAFMKPLGVESAGKLDQRQFELAARAREDPVTPFKFGFIDEEAREAVRPRKVQVLGRYCVFNEDSLACQILLLAMCAGEQGWRVSCAVWGQEYCLGLARKYFLGLVHGTCDSAGVAAHFREHPHTAVEVAPPLDWARYLDWAPPASSLEELLPPSLARIHGLQDAFHEL